MGQSLLALMGRMGVIVVMQVAMGLAIVIGGASLAPRRRLLTATVLAVVWSLLSGIMHIALHPNPQLLDCFTAGIAALAAAGGVLVVRSKSSGDQ